MWPFQAEDSERIAAAFALSPRRRVLYQLATGAGKTEVAIEQVSRHLAERANTRVGWLTHREELRDQSRARIEGAGVGVVDLTGTAPRSRRLLLNGVAIVSPEMRSVEALLAQATGDDLLIVDEAHHSVADSWDSKFIGPWPGYVLGLTATPWRLSRREGFGHLYDTLVCGPTTRELIDQGYLAEVTIVSPPKVVVRGAGRDVNGDYAAGAIEAENRALLYSNLPLRAWEATARHSKRTLWYAPTVPSAEALVAVLRGAGYPAGLVHAKTPEGERRQTIQGFDGGSIKHLVNIAVVTEGYDCPDADCVVIPRPTKSLALYWQMIGRVRRGAPGKRALALDLGQSWAEEDVGHPTDEYPWSLDPRGSAGRGSAPVRFCPDCSIANPAGARVCGGCGLPYGKDCPGCHQFRFEVRWTDMDGDEVCAACALGQLVEHVVEREDLPGDWNPNGTNTVLWHRTRRCHVMRSRSDHREWLVGYKPDPGRGRMVWVRGFPSFQTAFEAVGQYVAGGFVDLPEAPDRGDEAGLEGDGPNMWRWNRDGTGLWDRTGKCLVMLGEDGDGPAVLGYEARRGGMKWLAGYPGVDAAKEAADTYLADTAMEVPHPASEERGASREWLLSVAGYRVMKSRYGRGWIYGYPVENDPAERNMVYVTDFASEGEALDAAFASLEESCP